MSSTRLPSCDGRPPPPASMAGPPRGRRSASMKAEALSWVSASSASGSESKSSVAPARTCATPLRMRMVRRVRPVFMLPSKPRCPMAPPYHARGVFSWSSRNCMAQALGAPVTVTAQVWARKASSASKPSRSSASTWSTVWMRREYISICRRPMTCTDPGLQMRDLSLRSTSVHMVSSLSSLRLLRSVRMFSASSMAVAPREMVPLMGHVSMRRPRQRTYISGEAPTRYSWLPRLMKKL
mmetsp:Transcript_81304/g.218655  ORF Transcript_81304/g.218655 Transcript_81304/m.218655 type:complete len:239 (+) Transcript_81304:761-1477(+)